MDRQNVLIRLSPVPTSLLWLPAEQLVWPVAYSRVHLQQHSKCYDRSITLLHQQRLPPQPLCASWMRCCLHMSLRLHGQSWWITPTTLLSHIQHAKVILCLPNSMCGIHPVFHISMLEPSTPFYCNILYLLFDVRILNVVLYVSRRGMYACVRRWVICIRPRGVWLSTGIDVRLRRASRMYMTVSVSIPRGYMRIDDVRFECSVWWSIITISWGRNGTIPMVTELLLLSNKL